jgi:type VI secretion system protein ImpH
MDPETRKDLTGLIQDLEKRAPEYNVFYAIYIAEKISKKIHPDRDDGIFDQKGLRFRPYEYYLFPPKDIRSFEYDKGIMTFVLNFMGLYGINSPLPRCYHEQVPYQQNVHGPGHVPLQNFLDIFNNRFYWLYYLAWKKYRHYLRLSDETDDAISQRLFSFIGGAESVKEDKLIPKFKLLSLSSILSHRVRNKMGLHILLKEFFPRINFKVEEFIPHRVDITELSELGSPNRDLSFVLGKTCFVGRSMWDCNGRICVEVGPLDFEEYLEFTPQGEKAELLRYLLNFYLNDSLEYDIRFILRSKTIDTVPWNDHRLQLGVSLWLGQPAEEFVEAYYPYERYS